MAANCEPERLVIPRWLKVLTTAFAVVVAAAIAFAVFEPIQVLPRIRLAPGFAMTDQQGERFTSESVRGSIVLYSFGDVGCGAPCDELGATMADVEARVRDTIDFGDVEFRLVTVVLGGELPTPDAVSWTHVTSDTDTLSTVIGSGFRRYFDATDPANVRFDPGFIIVDGNGIVRGDYRYQTLANEADKLVRHLGVLADELRYGDGPAGVAYEAAHLFLCYP